jgi:NAD(P)H-flavin reductase
MMRAPVARAAVVLFGARARRDLYDLERVEKMAARWKETFSFMPILSDEAPDSDWTGRRGLVTDYISGKWVFRLDSCHAYLSGPPAMIDAALAVLVRAGIPHAHIHYDKFLDARELDSRANTSAPTLN